MGKSTQRLVPTAGGKLKVTALCDVTGEEYAVLVEAEAWKAWRNGLLAQNAFPDLSNDQREFIISGTTPAEWKRLWPDP